MEPVTHILTGACLSRAGLNRRAAYTTLTMALAAEFPDIDTLWSLRGSVAGFQHHRGITHTFIALPMEAALIVGGVYVVHRVLVRNAKATEESGSRLKPLTHAPVQWGLLYGFALIAMLSHLFLDFSNNYGLRPFFPFNPRWYAGSFVFIFDPVIFLLLGMAFLMPPLFALVNSEVGGRKQPFRGRGWATASLLCIVAMWSLRAVEHAKAVEIASAQSMTIAQPEGVAQFLQPLRVLANPDPFSPFRWHIVSDFGGFYQLSEANLLDGSLTPAQNILAKPERTPALLAAEASPLGRAYMDWSPMPLLSVSLPGDPGRVQTDVSDDPRSASATIVTFRDPRFMIDVPLLRSRPSPPLTGTVELDAQNRILRQTMDGSVQR